ncbi:MAG: hypothetical protein ACC707_13350 [Thiohalomonadales bacterium]
MSNKKPMSDAHIHAFVDKQLKREREERLQELVAAWPEKFEQIQEYQLINQRLLEGLADVYDQAIPDWITQTLQGGKLPARSLPASPVKEVQEHLNEANKKNLKKPTNPAPPPNQVPRKPTALKPPLADKSRRADANQSKNNETKGDVKSAAVEILVEPDVNETAEIRELDIDLPRHFRFTAFSDLFSNGVTRLKKIASGNMKVVASLVVGVIVGWTTHNVVNAYTRNNSPEVAQSAIDAHIFYAAESEHAVEVSAKHKKHLRDWIKFNLKTALEPVNLKKFGFDLMGGRILPLKGKLAGQYMYSNSSDELRLTIYMSAYLQDTSGTQLKCEIVDKSDDLPLSACGWRKEKIVYYVISNLSIEKMQEISLRVKSLMPKKKKA